MPKMRRKADLPTKTCAACGLPFAWRKKWARDWDQVRYCSDRCRAKGKAGAETGDKARARDGTQDEDRSRARGTAPGGRAAPV